MLPLSPHRLVLLSLVLALLAAAVVARPPLRAAPSSDQDAHDPAPAGMPLPQLPGIEDPDPSVAPRPQPLLRDGVLVDRFTAPGQSVAYPFLAETGELSLFELAAAGFARGWTMAAALRVLGPQGEVLAEHTTSGGVQLQAFLAFTAPAAGEYRVEVVPTDQYFRYVLVRHSDYAPRRPEPIAVGDRQRVHGWVADGSDRALYLVPVRAGEGLAVSVQGTRPAARSEHRRHLTDGATGADRRGMRRAGSRESDGATPRLFPELRLEVLGQIPPSAATDTFVLLEPAATDGLLKVAVGVATDQQGGLFDLVVRRDEPTHEVRGLVVDTDDELLEGIVVRLLLEPDLEPWGRTTTDASGSWAVNVPAGDYRVELRRAGAGPVQVTSAGVHGDTELNLLWRGP